VILLSLAIAAAPLLRECEVSVGQVQVCSATAYNGTTPVEQPSGRVYTCRVFVGVVGACATPYTGTTPLVRGPKVVSCSVDHGNITRCSATGFTGSAVLSR
jgi:hypothetical protein